MIRNIQHGFRIISDIISILFAFGYCISIGFMLLFKIGEPLLNYMMLGLTAVFLIFLIIKLVLLRNKPKKSGKVSKYGKRTYKYSKHIMRLVNAIMIIVSIVNVNMWDGSIVAPLVTLFVNITGFFFMILFDIIIFLVKKKLSEKREQRQQQKLILQQSKAEAKQKNASKERTSFRQLIETARNALETNNSSEKDKKEI